MSAIVHAMRRRASATGVAAGQGFGVGCRLGADRLRQGHDLALLMSWLPGDVWISARRNDAGLVEDLAVCRLGAPFRSCS